MKSRCLVPAMSTAILLTCGCATNRESVSMNQAIPADFYSTCEMLNIRPTELILTVDVASQTLSLFEDGRLIKQFPCSTSRFGVGQIEGSNCTPLGLHCIAEKIGEGQPPGTVFKSRKVIGHTSEPQFADAKITTRILWLEGLEPGYNQGTNVDSHARYIYIHGTGDQESIGEPASHGCIHLADDDLLWIYDKVPSGTLVWISKK